MQEQYNPSKIESAMQKRWQEQDVFTAKEQPGKDKFYCLSMFPYLAESCTWGMFVIIL